MAKLEGELADSFRREHPILSWFKETFSDDSVEDEVNNFWRRGERELLDELEKKETQEKIAEFVESLRKRGTSYATYYARCFEQYKKTKPKENEIRQQEDRCREQLRTASAKKWNARLTLAPVAGGKAN